MDGAPVSRFKGVHGWSRAWSPGQGSGLGGPWVEPWSGVSVRGQENTMVCSSGISYMVKMYKCNVNMYKCNVGRRS